MTPKGRANEKTSEATRPRKYWLWVTRPDYYLEYPERPGDLTLREMLDPEVSPGVQGWWTCHRSTEPGDLVLLYRTKLDRPGPRSGTQIGSDIAYLIEAQTNAFTLPEQKVPFASWRWGCNFVVHRRLARTLSWREMKEDPVLSSCWGLVHGVPQQQVLSIPEPAWERLAVLLAARDPGVARILETLTPQVLIERRRDEIWLEEKLMKNPGLLEALGYPILEKQLQRQVHCAEISARIDILCRLKGKHWLVAELKARTARPTDLTQTMQYVGWVATHLAAPHETVEGLLVAPDFDPKVRAAVSQAPRIRLAAWAEKGRRLTVTPLPL